MLVSTALRLEICIITVIVKGRVLLEIPSYIGMRIYMNLKVYILQPLNLIFSQAMLKIVVNQMLIVTNVPVNSAAL